jgi:NADPH-dependent 2,4-dienoyl-CoA reductase/sulfur reductase-like enzyme
LRQIAIVGAGLAGVTAAGTLRAEGFDGRIVLISDEPDLPYDRPPLSKKSLETGLDDMADWLKPLAFYSEQGIELLQGCTVDAVDLSTTPQLCLRGGARLRFDRLLLATGVSARRLPLAADPALPLHYLRTLGDARALRTRLTAGSHLLIIGGGFIGLEVASTARKLGCAVTVLEVDQRLLCRVATPRLSAHVRRMQEDNGVRVITGAALQRLAGSATEVQATLADGQTIHADAVLVGIGAVPNIALAEACGITVANGITVDAEMRTSSPLVFAAGDVCSQWNGIHGRQVRLEAWQNAERQGRAAARAMLGQPQPYCEAPWFWSDQFDTNIQILGVPAEWDTEILRGDPASGKFSQFLLNKGRVVGATFINEGRNTRYTRELIDRALPVDARKLADPARPIKEALA